MASFLFPDLLKCAEVTPAFKKNDILDKTIIDQSVYYLVSLKVFEGILIDQMTSFFKTLLSHLEKVTVVKVYY